MTVEQARRLTLDGIERSQKANQEALTKRNEEEAKKAAKLAEERNTAIIRNTNFAYDAISKAANLGYYVAEYESDVYDDKEVATLVRFNLIKLGFTVEIRCITEPAQTGSADDNYAYARDARDVYVLRIAWTKP